MQGTKLNGNTLQDTAGCFAATGAESSDAGLVREIVIARNGAVVLAAQCLETFFGVLSFVFVLAKQPEKFIGVVEEAFMQIHLVTAFLCRKCLGRLDLLFGIGIARFGLVGQR